MRTGIRLLAAASVAFFLFIGGLAGQSLSSYIRTDKPEAVIDIRAGQQSSFRIPRTVYGIYTENVGNEIYGGLSAQLLENPSLEDYHASLQVMNTRFSDRAFVESLNEGLPLPWQPLRNVGKRYESIFGPGAANSDRYIYLIGLPHPEPKGIKGRPTVATDELGIRQGIYLPVHRELEYVGSLFASSVEGPVRLMVSFRTRDNPDKILASTDVQVPDGERWTKLPFRLRLPAGAVKSHELVDFSVSIIGPHRFSLDMIRLYPADAVEGYFDPEVLKATREMNFSLVRWGGNFMSTYHWEDGVGPPDKRRTQLNRAWGTMEYNEFGTDEFMSFCRLAGVQPMICMNLGSGAKEEARKWVEYVNGASTTPQGARRAANGHRDPYPATIWELGNELWGDDQMGWQTPTSNAARYLEFFPVVRKQALPGAMLVACGPGADFTPAWTGALIKNAGKDLSYISVHYVVRLNQLVAKAPDADTQTAIPLALPVGMANLLKPIREQIDADPATKGRVGLAYTEWNWGGTGPSSTNIGGAVMGAGWMNMMLSQADFVPISSMSGLMGGGGLRKSQGMVWATPQCWAFWLYSHRAADTVVATETQVRHYDVHDGMTSMPEIPNVPYLDVLATRNSASGDLALFVANRDWKNSTPATLRLEGFSAAAQAQVDTLAADSPLTENTADRPDAIRPVSSFLAVSGNEIRYVFPKLSVTVITLKRR
ncbi:MAG: alpha-L-arabinofuranosidase C-terminal domain-containing protein [Bryobacteraceae bacterium]|jgi:alpha-N-arabinofuranosidase